MKRTAFSAAFVAALVSRLIFMVALLPSPATGEFQSLIHEAFSWYYEERFSESILDLRVQSQATGFGDSGMYFYLNRYLSNKRQASHAPLCLINLGWRLG